MNGTVDEKEEYSFKLMVSKKNSWFDLNDFTTFLKTMINIWNVITSTYQSKIIFH